MKANSQTLLEPAAALVRLLDRPAILLDLDGTIRTANAAFAAIARSEPAFAPGSPLAGILDPARGAALRRYVEEQSSPGASGARFTAELVLEGATFCLSVAPHSVGGRTRAFLCQVEPMDGRDALRLRYLLDHLDQAVWDYDVASDSFAGSAAWRRMRGVGPDDIRPVSMRDWLEPIHTDDREGLLSAFGEQIDGRQADLDFQYRLRQADGQWAHILCRARVVEQGPDGRPSRIAGTDTDVTDLNLTEIEMTATARKLQMAIDAMRIGVWEFDPNIPAVHWDERSCETYGYPPKAGYQPPDIWERHIHPDDAAATIAHADACHLQGIDFHYDYRIVRADGAVRYIRSRAGIVPVPLGQPKLIGLDIDITNEVERARELELVRAQLQHEALHDPLTGLGNRRLLEEATRDLKGGDATRRFAVLHLDLDRFKDVNDLLGHAAGDELLVALADRLVDVVDGAGLVCRVGGDEFVAFLGRGATEALVNRLGRGILAAMEPPVWIGQTPVRVGLSIGAALSEAVTDDFKETLLRADLALYAAKRSGRRCYRLHPGSRVDAALRIGGGAGPDDGADADDGTAEGPDARPDLSGWTA